MKVFISALVALALITSFVVFAGINSHSALSSMLERSDTLPDTYTNEEEHSGRITGVLSEIREIWERKRFTLSLSISHRELDEIDLSLRSLEASVAAEDVGNYADALSILKERLRLLESSEHFSPDGIV